MKRLTTDHPENNFETALNFVYGKDGAAYLRSDGERDDVPLHEWAKKQCVARGCGEFPGETLEEIDQAICDCGFDYPDCPVHLAYTFACQAVHLRDRLKMYEDTWLMPEDVTDLMAAHGAAIEKLEEYRRQPANAPLTLEELREMDGEPVWIVSLRLGDGCWNIADCHTSNGGLTAICESRYCPFWFWMEYGITWLAYRRKPEEGTISKMEVERHEKV